MKQHRHGRALRDTVRGDVQPPRDHLSYRPRNDRYCLLAVWGWKISADALLPSGASRASRTFVILDGATGDEHERLTSVSGREAGRIAPILRERVKRLNRADAA